MRYDSIYNFIVCKINYCVVTDHLCMFIQGDTKKRELLKNPTKIEEIQEKKFIDRN